MSAGALWSTGEEERSISGNIDKVGAPPRETDGTRKIIESEGEIRFEVTSDSDLEKGKTFSTNST